MDEHLRKQAEEILLKFQEGTATDQEEQLVRNWLSKATLHDPDGLFSKAEEKALFESIKTKIAHNRKQTFKMNVWRYSAAAAVLVACLSVLAYFNLDRMDGQSSRITQVIADDVLPAHSAAVLELSDGTKVDLDSAQSMVMGSSGVKINGKSGVISFEEKGDIAPPLHGEIKYNTIRTARGRQYTVILPDGTLAKLNANSSIRFPDYFVDKRYVEIDGEVYFDVKRDETKKFVVHASDQFIEVLGTQFNIKAYQEEQVTSTALISGSLLVTSRVGGTKQSRILKPGQIAKNGPNMPLTVYSTDIEKEKSFQKGEFYFDGENLDEILAILSRWYDVQFIYETSPSRDIRYGGVISRDKNLSSVLKLLEDREKMQFIIKGKEVIIRKQAN